MILFANASAGTQQTMPMVSPHHALHGVGRAPFGLQCPHSYVQPRRGASLMENRPLFPAFRRAGKIGQGVAGGLSFVASPIRASALRGVFKAGSRPLERWRKRGGN